MIYPILLLINQQVPLIFTAGGDSSGMSETDESPQRTRSGGDGSSLPRGKRPTAAKHLTGTSLRRILSSMRNIMVQLRII